MYRAVIFDLDGTLVDTLGDIRYLLNQTLSYFGLPQISREQASEYIGNGAALLVKRAVGERYAEFYDRVYARFKVSYAANDNSRSTLFDGEEAALKELSSLGVKLAVLTNKPQAATDGVMAKFFKDYPFDSVHGQSETFPLKPSVKAVERVLEELGTTPADTVIVGDGETDIAAARGVGADCISVLWGYRTKARLLEAGGNVFVSSFGNLMEILREKI